MQKYYFSLMILGLFVLIYGCNVKPMEKVSQCDSSGKVKISNLQDKYNAGDKIDFRIRTKDLKNEDIIIVWDGKFGEQYFEKRVYGEDFIFAFPDSISQQSGLVNIKIASCNKILARAKTYISSLYPVGTIESYLGPKTLAIDQNLESMLCLIPTDKYHNPMEENDTVSFTTKYSGFPSINEKQSVKNLLSCIKIKNNKQTGKVLLGAKCTDAYIDEQEVAIVQGPMQVVKVNIVNIHPYSDQRQQVHLNTDIIYDAMGNVVADGTSVVFIVQEKGEVRARYQTYTVSGIATVYIENPMYATIWDVSIAGSLKSSSLELVFQDNIASIPLRIEKEYLVVGPVVGSFDQYIPDGTNVKVIFNYAINRAVEMEHGFAKVKIPSTILESDEIICEVEINSQKVKLIY